MPIPKTAPATGLALSADAAAAAALAAAMQALGFRLELCTTLDELARRWPALRPDLLVVDLDLGDALAGAAVQLLREQLCGDGVPLVLLCAAEADGERFTRRWPGAIDFRLVKPLDEAGLRGPGVALRRMVALRRITRAALDRVGEAVLVIDDRGTVRQFNAAAEAMFGWPAEQVIGRSVELLMPAARGAEHGRYMRDYRRSGVARVIGIGRVESALRRDGSEFTMHLTVADVSDGQSRRFVGVIRDLSALQQGDELEQMLLRDSLTGLPNRARAQQELAAALQRQAAGGAGCSLLFCDIDDFKRINDGRGHRVGDEVLRAVASRLRHAVQEKDLVARFAGDEFIVVLQGMADAGCAERIAARVAEVVSQPVSVGDQQVPVSVSIGAATAATGESAAALFDRADQRMYAIKRAKR